MFYDYPNETILPIRRVVKWVKYLSDVNTYHICKSRYGLHLTEWPAANPSMRQEWQAKLRRALKVLWEADVKTGAISSAYLKKQKRNGLDKPDYYAFCVCCLIYSNIRQIDSWLESNLQITVTPTNEDSWYVQFYGQNITDELNVTGIGLGDASVGQTRGVTVRDPQVFGIRVGYNF